MSANVKKMLVVQCPSELLSITNNAIINPQDFPENVGHIVVSTGPQQHFVFTVKPYVDIPSGKLALNLCQRNWATLSVGQEIEVQPYNFDQNAGYLCTIVVEADYFTPRRYTTLQPYDTDELAKEFQQQFSGLAFTVGQQVVFQIEDKKMLRLVVKSLETVDITAIIAGINAPPEKVTMGRCWCKTVILFEKAEQSSLNLVGKSKGRVVCQSLINPDCNFQNIGIGGLDEEFSIILRRAFASRILPFEVLTQLNIKHTRGILLYGPPGTGKTLIARQIATMLNTSREPIIVNGLEILDKYVGESKANIKRLFADAEEEEKRLGPNSGLHIIVFDEIDAICKSRGTITENSELLDAVVNQLLAKIDGVEQLNNIVIIGMTNRKDLIDEALLGPGRLEVQLEFSLPGENGRLQVLNIHTATMSENNKLSSDVNLKELAEKGKNFSGDVRQGLVKAAQRIGMNRLFKASNKFEVDPAAMKKLVVSRNDFLKALDNNIMPAFGLSTNMLDQLFMGGIIIWGKPVTEILTNGNLCIQMARSMEVSGILPVLLEGPPNSGKTALAAQIAKNSGFSFVQTCIPEDMLDLNETAKCEAIRKIFYNAYCSKLSCILIDGIENLIDYVPLGPRFSNLTLQALLVLFKKQPPLGHKLLILCTTSNRRVLEEMGMLSAFTSILHVPNLSDPGHLINVIKDFDLFNKAELSSLHATLREKRFSIGIKKLLSLTDLVKVLEPKYRLPMFLSKLKEEGFLE
ncbi:vesicle-fusing ATPase 2-like [Prorops nasuta]|uniref:vesicle-fusing ATPase 2-like n=1 Tax=Prorops nasuta TaxID=863751 RepID=UPI0034CD1908